MARCTHHRSLCRLRTCRAWGAAAAAGTGKEGKQLNWRKCEEVAQRAARQRLRRRATRHLFTAPTVLKCGGRGRRGEEARQGSCLTLFDSRCCGGEPLGCFLPSLVRPSSRCARPRAAARPPARWRVVVPSFCSLPNAENETLSESESDGPPFYPSAARVLPFVVRCAVGRRRGGRQEETRRKGQHIREKVVGPTSSSRSSPFLQSGPIIGLGFEYSFSRKETGTGRASERLFGERVGRCHHRVRLSSPCFVFDG